MNYKIAIVGAGIIGISSGISLLQRGLGVTIFTKDHPLSTNSDAAVALWYGADNSKPLLKKLCLESLPKLYELSKTENSGVSIIPVAHYFKNEEFIKSIWSDKTLQKHFKITDITHELPSNLMPVKGFERVMLTHIPLADCNIYRPFLLETFKRLGGRIQEQKVTALTDLFTDYNIVINNAGWEAKYLTEDTKIYPVRGQIEIAKMGSELKSYCSLNVADIDGYVVFRPQSMDYVIGSTHQINNIQQTPSETDRVAILQNILPFFPEAESVHTVSKVGIRCGREEVRLESEQLNIHGELKTIIHCYGHGGRGFSASWGSANQVVKECLSRQS